MVCLYVDWENFWPQYSAVLFSPNVSDEVSCPLLVKIVKLTFFLCQMYACNANAVILSDFDNSWYRRCASLWTRAVSFCWLVHLLQVIHGHYGNMSSPWSRLLWLNVRTQYFRGRNLDLTDIPLVLRAVILQQRLYAMHKCNKNVVILTASCFVVTVAVECTFVALIFKHQTGTYSRLSSVWW